MFNLFRRLKAKPTDPTSLADARIQEALKNRKTALDLSGVGLTELPESVARLSRLWGLVLSDNQLTMLPESVGQLSQLQILRLDGNRLTTLPEALRKLTRLEQLYLHDNEALGLPAEVLGPSWEGTPFNSAKPAAILDYYFRM